MRGLQDLYKKFNHELFSNRLPRYTVRLSSQALPGIFCHGVCLPASHTIRLRRDLPGNMLRQVLLHEMCHVACLDDPSGLMHGPLFQQELARLAALGEEWAGTEAATYRDGVLADDPGETLRLEIEAMTDVSWRRRKMLVKVLCEPLREKGMKK